MQKSLLKTVLFSALVVVSAASMAQADKFLADRHVGRGVACASCHADKAPAPGVEVPTTACTSCHGDIEAMGAVTRKKNLRPDPHYNNHLIGVSCLECHQGHKSSKNVCSTCHMIQFKVP